MLHEDWNIAEHTSLNSTIVVTVNSHMEDGNEVKKTEDGVEDYFPKAWKDIKRESFHSKGHNKCVHAVIGIGRDIGMPELVDLDEDKDHHDVHHGGVKLKTDVAGTDMENCTEDLLR